MSTNQKAPNIRQIKALRHYAAELAMATVGLRLQPCGCVFKRVPPVGTIKEAYVVQKRCDAHGGDE